MVNVCLSYNLQYAVSASFVPLQYLGISHFYIPLLRFISLNIFERHTFASSIDFLTWEVTN